MIPIFQFTANIDPNNLISSLFGLGGNAFRIIAVVIQVLLIVVVLAIAYYILIVKRNRYPIIVEVYEIVGGKVMKSQLDRGGFIIAPNGSQTFRLLPRLSLDSNKRRRPPLIQPKLSDFQATLGGKRYINYLRTGKEVYVPFSFTWNLEEHAIVEIAKDIDFGPLKSEIAQTTSSLINKGFWNQYGNQVILIAFAMVLGIWLFLVAKEFTQTAIIVQQGQEALAAALDTFGKQIVQ